MTSSITELVFILDKSGSMAGLESDTVGGFNAMMKKQKELDGVCYVTTVLFDDASETLHDRVPLLSVPAMTERDYTVGGCTALLDALGRTICHIETIHRYARPEDLPGHTLFVITTDGMENASRHYTAEQIKTMISQKKERHGWEFLFIGANMDAVTTAARYGIDKNRAVDYRADSEGTRAVYASVEKAVSTMRACQPLAADWSDEIKSNCRCKK